MRDLHLWPFTLFGSGLSSRRRMTWVALGQHCFRLSWWCTAPLSVSNFGDVSGPSSSLAYKPWSLSQLHPWWWTSPTSCIVPSHTHIFLYPSDELHPRVSSLPGSCCSISELPPSCISYSSQMGPFSYAPIGYSIWNTYMANLDAWASPGSCWRVGLTFVTEMLLWLVYFHDKDLMNFDSSTWLAYFPHIEHHLTLTPASQWNSRCPNQSLLSFCWLAPSVFCQTESSLFVRSILSPLHLW